MINIIYEDNHLLVVEKPINVPVQEDSSKDLDFLTLLKDFIKKRDNKPGNVYLGLIHRLDRPVGGIMVFAKTSKCASRLSEQVRNRIFKKTYYAIVEGKVEKKGTLIDKLLKDTKNNIVKVDKNGKESILDYELVDYKDNLSLVKINLKTGRSHQIRVQFSSRGHALYGDQKYNINSKVGEQIALFSNSITINHPITKECLTFEIDLPNRKPWNIFNKKI
ncbi:MAG: RluA family pseudouridine synthase [Firmicutes bacterium]|nr:RluA family pseudouridine synthase [Bacillota bacterium]